MKHITLKHITLKKIIGVGLASILSVGLLASCQKQPAQNDLFHKKTIKIAASSVPHADILKKAKTLFHKKGYDLDIVEFNDYVQPNLVVESGEFDANYFQHPVYLKAFNKEHNTHLVNAGVIHYEPLGIYAGKQSNLKNISKGAKIAIPNDTTNEARALLLLQDNGLLKLKSNVGLNATIKDIADNPHQLQLIELEAAQIPRVKDEMDYVILNGNYAIQSNYSVKKDALAKEESSSDAAKNYANIITVKKGNENAPIIKELVEILQSAPIQDYILEKYDGSVIPTK